MRRNMNIWLREAGELTGPFLEPYSFFCEEDGVRSEGPGTEWFLYPRASNGEQNTVKRGRHTPSVMHVHVRAYLDFT